MKSIKLALVTLAAVAGVQAFADVTAIQPGSREEGVANVASQIQSVTSLKIGTTAYQIVSMDSELNGDTTMTTIVLVGDQGVGGEAGYDAAFQLSPTADLRNMKSATKNGNNVDMVFYNQDGKLVKTSYHYDAATKTLIGK